MPAGEASNLTKVADDGLENTAKEVTTLVNEVRVHGNSLKSTKPTWGYELYSNDGTF